MISKSVNSKPRDASLVPPSVSSKLARCDCPDFSNSGEKKENYGIIAGSLHGGDFILANFSPPSQSIRYMEHDYPPAFWWGGNSIPHGAVVEQTDTSVFLQKEKYHEESDR
jgi:hypothetical protein